MILCGIIIIPTLQIKSRLRDMSWAQTQEGQNPKSKFSDIKLYFLAFGLGLSPMYQGMNLLSYKGLKLVLPK